MMSEAGRLIAIRIRFGAQVAQVPGMDSSERVVHRIVEAARRVHGELGPGFIESIYGRALITELKNTGLHVEREKLIKIWYASSVVRQHRLDLVVD